MLLMLRAHLLFLFLCFFFQAEDGIRDLVRSRGLGDVYKRQPDGAVIKPNNVITNGPFVEIKEAIGRYTIIKCETMEEAVELSKNCPILFNGGSVEVRTIVPMD